jgi:hypothetical protein
MSKPERGYFSKFPLAILKKMVYNTPVACRNVSQQESANLIE